MEITDPADLVQILLDAHASALKDLETVSAHVDQMLHAQPSTASHASKHLADADYDEIFGKNLTGQALRRTWAKRGPRAWAEAYIQVIRRRDEKAAVYRALDTVMRLAGVGARVADGDFDRRRDLWTNDIAPTVPSHEESEGLHVASSTEDYWLTSARSQGWVVR